VSVTFVRLCALPSQNLTAMFCDLGTGALAADATTGVHAANTNAR
jgi:hypothetical protein